MNKNNWATPKEVFHPLDDIFHFDLDVCADSMNHKTPTYISEKEDALLCKWAGVCWMNPPYERGKINSFMKKAWQEYCEGTQIVALVPASMSSVWFHRYALKGRIYIYGRVGYASFLPKLTLRKVRQNATTFWLCTFKMQRIMMKNCPKSGGNASMNEVLQ